MKKFILSGLTALLFLLIVTSSCSKKEASSITGSSILHQEIVEKVYVISPKTMRIYSVYEVTADPGIGPKTIKYNEILVETLQTKDVYESYSCGIIKSGLTFQKDDDDEVLPAFFLENDSLIRPIERFYLKMNNYVITDFRILGDELYEKKLSKIEVDNLSVEVRAKMSFMSDAIIEYTK